MTIEQLSAWLREADEYRIVYDFGTVIYITFRKHNSGMQIDVQHHNRVPPRTIVWITNRVRRLARPGEYKLIMVEAALRGLLNDP